jgi:hypothetical protein
VAGAGLLLVSGCMSAFEGRHQAQSDAREQIWRADDSQVLLRAAQSRRFATADRPRVLAGVVQSLQDLGFQIEALDERLGIVSGSRFDPSEGAGNFDPTYHLYHGDTLLCLSRSYRSWGPFWHRADLVRVTVTVRRSGTRDLVVRANAQFYLRAVESAEPYQRFFAALERALALPGMVDPEPAGG